MRRPAQLLLPLALTALMVLAAPVQAQQTTQQTTQATGTPETGVWTYGEHPLWGLSAYVTAGGESVGLRCLPDRGFTHPAVALMLTPGLVRPHANFPPTEAIQRYRFVGDPGMGEGMIAQAPGGHFEMQGTTCDVSLDSFRAARALLFYDETADVMALDDATAERAPGLIARIPLDGAKTAIDRLVRACPAIRKDIENGCGI
ncbi:hypothetical protein [Blastochloris tepida]|uniref:Uncharacterized protein n=1 Tax=Blastochloris tepida TaxID=2233851 RepID=A0A348G1P0_9HYPH|nr:hypothetical protein [Blastochloris tepida]BBF93473.1 hypothetical protein BLTE_21580 [Blastochloris tepida]